MENEPVMKIGMVLKRARESHGLSLSDLSQDLQIPVEYLKALEEENYRIFSAKIYAKGFFQKTIQSLLPEGGRGLADAFEESWKENSKYSLGRNKNSQPAVLASGRLGIFTGVTIALFLLVFFGWRIYGFILPPKLDLVEPGDRILLDEPKVRLRGSVQKESIFTVNGREINTNSRGEFDSELNLTRGLNRLDFYAQSRFGKTSQVIRYVVVK